MVQQQSHLNMGQTTTYIVIFQRLHEVGFEGEKWSLRNDNFRVCLDEASVESSYCILPQSKEKISFKCSGRRSNGKISVFLNFFNTSQNRTYTSYKHKYFHIYNDHNFSFKNLNLYVWVRQGPHTTMLTTLTTSESSRSVFYKMVIWN